jgi:hypothetical protein
MIYLILYSIFIAYSISAGIIEGYLYFYKYSNNYTFINTNLHPLYDCQRLIVLIGLCMCIYTMPFWIILLFALSCCLQFPWTHDGFYYLCRHELKHSDYPKGFFDNSTEERWDDFKLWMRIVFLLLSIIIISFLSYYIR